ncbi:RlmF-related methyltransferase [Thermococcus sp. SY098]|uniref:RlmF-related methyltransferase n=1 Tax=Thermococcus sp. SY098 TaxID=3111325 RepID=UPI002D78B60E|nr:RlmF-related methyltransferase [Thermococcus sp. SY098]WRS51746.1 RlmF-related methyltransferase [Thermococcus sp. SY098]
MKMIGLKIEEALKIFPELQKYIKNGKLDFSSREARILYNKAVAKAVFDLKIEYHPKGLITPPISRYIFLKTFLRGGEKVLEIGTGHSALMAIIAAKLFNCEAWATEINEEFFEYAKRNIECNKVQVKLIKSKGQIIKGLIPEGEKFDVIFSAPPYYEKPTKGVLTPIEAVGGGKYGEKFSLKLLREAKDYLKPKGKVALFLPDKAPLLNAITQEAEKMGYKIRDIKFKAGTRVRHSLIFTL